MAVEADVAEDKSGKMLNRVQNGLNLQLHGWSAAPWSIDLRQRLISPRPAFFNPLPARIFALPCRCGSEDRALQECNLSAEPPVDCSDCIPSGPGQRSDRIPVFRMPLQATAKAKNSSPLSAVMPLFFRLNHPQILPQTLLLLFLTLPSVWDCPRSRVAKLALKLLQVNAFYGQMAMRFPNAAQSNCLIDCGRDVEVSLTR